MEQGLALVQAADYISQPYYSNYDDQLMIQSITRAFRNILSGEDYEADLIKLEEKRWQLFD